MTVVSLSEFEAGTGFSPPLVIGLSEDEFNGLGSIDEAHRVPEFPEECVSLDVEPAPADPDYDYHATPRCAGGESPAFPGRGVIECPCSTCRAATISDGRFLCDRRCQGGRCVSRIYVLEDREKYRFTCACRAR